MGIQCPDNVLLERAKGRRIGAKNGKIYHIHYVPPPKNMKKKHLIKRDMDNNIKSRLEVYHAQHRRFKFDDKYKKKMVNINGNKPIKEVFKDIMNVMYILKEEVNNEDVDDVKVEPNECTICMNNPSDHIIVPCGHQCGCKQCLVTLKQNGGKCPICRGPINVIQKVYASHTVIVQKIENTENQILNEDAPNDDELWPEDAKDD